MNPPQAVTSRYVRRLILRGINDEFEILNIGRDISIEDDICVGVFFRAMIKATKFEDKFSAAGATPEQATERCLAKFGVTFR